ncbi:homoserine dehydrogenase [Cytobacillus firmus]|uniref:homoserine dehydrogenase n=1 Tax=Cytobacillus firmus TaxID=1399 RepID=UPI00077CB28A|nr:homoserine dehydrogenase [Cytobacillus firmus]MBG9545805.1 homoserine dehydrogenase [Cytobacillus firmus]MBG9548278.1 homoserine dehydrogenase [Cytobacillus firmus]MBG9552968.1 homoserine dehydrogenase [Cytobacillus firmus]MBG9559628.1 homoserine dehydrogenase [Cytobacillus firmus]MBG9577636.1 homoserine dehydrogenase [Cytobacillus firmus]
MSAITIGLLGFGTVGKGVYETIRKHQERLQTILGKEVKVSAILVKNVNKHSLPDDQVLLTDDFQDIIELPKLDVVIDAIVGREPGYTYLRQAISRGCHVITANKEMFAYHGSELAKLAKEKNVSLGFEATVGGGIPIIQTIRQLLNANRIERIEGILNGTSNFILTSMREENLSFEEALKIAQDKGYAEADPKNDIEGYDAFYKAVVLSELVFGKAPAQEYSVREGITDITIEQIRLADSLGLKFKHAASIQKEKDFVRCTVKPVLTGESHPLYRVEGVQNAVSIDADIVGNISLQGPGAGMFPTASAIIEDLIHVGKADFPSAFEEAISKETVPEQPFWVILGDADQTVLPEGVEFVSKVSEQAIIVKAPTEAVSLLDKSDLKAYQVLGDYAHTAGRYKQVQPV